MSEPENQQNERRANLEKKSECPGLTKIQTLKLPGVGYTGQSGVNIALGNL